MQNQAGFTMIEIIVVMAIFIVVISFGTIVDLNTFNQDAFHEEVSKVSSILSKARSRAMANMFESQHGVCYDASTKSYVISRGSTCDPSAPTSELIPANTNIATKSDFANPANFPSVIFDQLAGSTTSATISITDGIKSTNITINHEGRINW